jgi:hypothetical protein
VRSDGNARGGLLFLSVKIFALWFVAALLAWPAVVLVSPGGADSAGERPGSAVLWLSVSAALAVAVAWWYRPVWPGLRLVPLLGRAVAVLAAASGTVLAWHAAGMPSWGLAGPAGGNALVAVLGCVAVWAALDRLPPAWLALLGALTLGASIGLAFAVDARGAMAVLTGVETGPEAGLRWGMVLTVVQIAAVALLAIAGWRLFDQWRTGTLAHAGDRSQGQWPPKAGQIWYADVPFQDSDGESKDRPVLVVRTGRRQAEVLKITSQDKSRYPEHYLFLPHPKWRQVLDKNSWLELRPVTLDYHRFHNLRGLARYGTVRTVRERVKPRPVS